VRYMDPDEVRALLLRCHRRSLPLLLFGPLPLPKPHVLPVLPSAASVPIAYYCRSADPSAGETLVVLHLVARAQRYAPWALSAVRTHGRPIVQVPLGVVYPGCTVARLLESSVSIEWSYVLTTPVLAALLPFLLSTLGFAPLPGEEQV
jgi:hypothetical protein